MTPKTPRVTARKIEKVLKRLGFRMVRQKGSHRVYRHEDGRRVIVPVHAARVLALGTLHAILEDAGLDEDALRRLL